MENQYLSMFYILIILAVALLALSVFLFFYLKIPKAINDLTGRTSKIAVEKSRERNKSSGVKQYKASKVNEKRGKITDNIDSDRESAAKVMYSAYHTDPIGESNATTILKPEASLETTLLSEEALSPRLPVSRTGTFCCSLPSGIVLLKVLRSRLNLSYNSERSQQ